jgi:RimJ/RimL family protein N-acetyltransferase
LNIELRPANEYDYPIIFAWRNNLDIYKGFYSQKGALVWEDHVKWFRSRNQDWRTFIILYKEDDKKGFYDNALWYVQYEHRPVGVVTLGQLDNWTGEVGYYLGELTLMGKGVGTEAVRQAIEYCKEYSKLHPHLTHIHTTIKYDNIASIKLIEKLGFKHMCEAREGEGRWERKL